MAKVKKKMSQGRAIRLTFLGIVLFGLVVAGLLEGKDITILNPKGLIAQEQMNLMVLSAAIMLAIAIPSLFLFYFFAWKYRETNQKAKYNPHTHNGRLFNTFVWGVPTIFMLILASVMWPATHRLIPQKTLSVNSSLKIQVVALRWKWLFIYPDKNVATVNFVQMPTGTPVEFELTADEAPMSSFWIPHMGGQLYAMTGHVNRLNLVADEPGDFPGRSAEINGAGFAGMQFMARASSQEEFDKWVRNVQRGKTGLDATEYESLLMPSESNLAAYYSGVEAGIYDKVLMKYMASHSHAEHE